MEIAIRYRDCAKSVDFAQSSFYNGHKFKYDSSQEEEIMPESFMGGIGLRMRNHGYFKGIVVFSYVRPAKTTL